MTETQVPARFWLLDNTELDISSVDVASLIRSHNLILRLEHSCVWCSQESHSQDLSLRKQRYHDCICITSVIGDQALSPQVKGRQFSY